jgi:single-strand DNA-binding protein
MGDVNKVMLLGTVGKNVDLQLTPSGTQIGKFSIAINKGKKLDNGEWDNITTWHNCVVFGKQAERSEGQILKGAKIFIEGEINVNKWTDKEGVQKSFTSILVSYFNIIVKSKNDESEHEEYANPKPKEEESELPY